jgi:16S rRNA (uracil1498-N3)-methyltransferase
MPAERFFAPQQLFIDQQISLSGAELHHLAHVMRLQTGETVEIVNGQGSLAEGVIEQIGKREALVRITKAHQATSGQTNIILVQAIPRLNRLEFILEKGTELGMNELWLFPSERSERKALEERQLERFQAITIAALKQCGRLFLPKIIVKSALDKWSAENVVPQAYYGDLNASSNLSDLYGGGDVQIFIGPESGFTEREEKRLRELGVKGVSLHQNILRTDTAALTALAIISCKFN